MELERPEVLSFLQVKSPTDIMGEQDRSSVVYKYQGIHKTLELLLTNFTQNICQDGHQ